MTDELRFDDRVVIVTGASRGLGRAQAITLAARGAKVVVNGRSAERVDSVVDEIASAGGVALAAAGDAADPATAARVVERAVSEFGRLDALINNAGGQARSQVSSFAETSADVRDSVMRGNFLTAWEMTAAAWPQMISQGYGRVVMFSSPVALWGDSNQAAYAAAKSAVVGLTKVLALEGAAHGINVNALSPVGYSEAMEESIPDEQVRAWLAHAVPGSAIATGAAWLVHEACRTSGELFQVTGPWMGRVPIGVGPGFASDLKGFTPEAIDANVGHLLATDGLVTPASPMEMVQTVTSRQPTPAS